MRLAPLPETRFRAASVVPPIVQKLDPVPRTPTPLPTAIVPVTSVPMKLPSMIMFPCIDSAIPASERLITFTTGRQTPARAALSLEELLRDDMPPLEDLIVGGQPAPVGLGSGVAVIVGGLFLLYRGLIDFRIPLMIVLVEFAGLMVLPIPASVSSHTTWHWLAFRRPDVGWAAGVTFANYEILASPALFMAFFLATSGPVRPMARRARTIYAILIGAMTAALQLYMNVVLAPYLALLMASLLTPALDRLFAPRPLV